MKINKLILVILPILFFMCGCNNTPKTDRFAPMKNNPKTDSIKTIKLEELELESMESSYDGNLFVKSDSIYFVDKRFCWIFVFDKDGTLHTRHLGRGQGPQEIASGIIDGYACLNDGGYFFMGPGADCYIFDEQFQRTKMFIFRTRDDALTSDGLTGYERPWIYTPRYSDLTMRNYKEYLYYTVYSEYEDYNFIDSPNSYFKNVHIIEKLNLMTGEEEQVLGYFPDSYSEDKSLRQLRYFFFDMDSKGNFYVAYEGDSLIYTFDQDYTPMTAFGYKGREMVDKPIVLDTESSSFWEEYAQNRKERGMYSGIVYIEETDILFRTYLKGADTGGGLQIYKESLLIGDVDVPNGFKIVGYIAPYYYACCGIDEENEKIILYKFKL